MSTKLYVFVPSSTFSLRIHMIQLTCVCFWCEWSDGRYYIALSLCGAFRISCKLPEASAAAATPNASTQNAPLRELTRATKFIDVVRRRRSLWSSPFRPKPNPCDKYHRTYIYMQRPPYYYATITTVPCDVVAWARAQRGQEARDRELLIVVVVIGILIVVDSFFSFILICICYLTGVVVILFLVVMILVCVFYVRL